MLLKPAECHGCGLEFAGAGFSHPDGTGANGVMLLGEALGEKESQTGKPFQGPAGLALNNILKQIGEPRENFVLWNTVACRPPGNRNPRRNEVAWCDQHFKKVLNQFRPLVIVTVGNVPLQKLLGITGVIATRTPKRGYVSQSRSNALTALN